MSKLQLASFDPVLFLWEAAAAAAAVVDRPGALEYMGMGMGAATAKSYRMGVRQGWQGLGKGSDAALPADRVDLRAMALCRLWWDGTPGR